MDLTLDLWTCDVGAAAASATDFATLLAQRCRDSLTSGADVVLFPEYAWMALERFLGQGCGLGAIAGAFWQKIWPELRREFSLPGKVIAFGSVPWQAPDGSWRNRCPILADGAEIFQDKLCLTPWETQFTGGESLTVFSAAGFRFAVLVCLDCELPEHAAALRGQQVDVLLVPSATETILGCERIARCCSARAVELGCGVAVAHLTGKCAASSMVDENVGRVAFFLPSQGPFMQVERYQLGEIQTSGFHRLRTTISRRMLEKMRARTAETNPAQCLPKPISVRFKSSDGNPGEHV